MDTNKNNARIRVVFIQVGFEVKNGLCRWLFGRRPEVKITGV